MVFVTGESLGRWTGVLSFTSKNDDFRGQS